ncbi:relaxase/mobilization nuclease domain-containing protein [Roseovarius nubinhibens]|uniref:MobA/VirD2-like nuclease domain-containing protein n=1 Tax=Roseovarius nubinhibens (strain ATCC BAA-591 / DSM 15170 / ISM) TaxID=89187 RepID=A3SLC8_ROSNI|nr:hypothetical protein [Roseovarius nubinhibens]EAP78159.1 hypothetical protein ISM_07680 [Roseovarius nubinhibens ISM]
MILNANTRGNAKELARHLLNTRDNDHVELHDLRGFIAEDLNGAFREAEAIAMGTKCINHLFSLSLSPPEYADVAVETFEKAIDRIEAELGLNGQPRAIVFHEKEGRRHAHAVWSRIDGQEMKAIKIDFYKRRLTDFSKQLFLENGWPLPDGLQDQRRRDPLSFSLSEWQQAKRTGLDPKVTKTLLRECWNVSDTCESFEAALREKGFWLAHGDRRSYVALDWRGEIYSLSRAIGVKKKELAVRLGNTKFLRSVDETKAHIGAQLTPKIQEWAKDAEAQAKKTRLSLTFKTEQMIQRQRSERESLRQSQALRWQSEERARAARTPRGIRGLWGWISGKNKKIRAMNEAEIEKAKTRDLAERQQIIRKQINERRRVQQMVMHVRRQQGNTLTLLAADVAKAMAMGRVPESAIKKDQTQERSINRRRTRDRGPDYEPN